jgi:hypothetical protein
MPDTGFVVKVKKVRNYLSRLSILMMVTCLSTIVTCSLCHGKREEPHMKVKMPKIQQPIQQQGAQETHIQKQPGTEQKDLGKKRKLKHFQNSFGQDRLPSSTIDADKRFAQGQSKLGSNNLSLRNVLKDQLQGGGVIMKVRADDPIGTTPQQDNGGGIQLPDFNPSDIRKVRADDPIGTTPQQDNGGGFDIPDFGQSDVIMKVRADDPIQTDDNQGPSRQVNIPGLGDGMIMKVMADGPLTDIDKE